MVATIKHSDLKGCLKLPASKSISQRACMLALLNYGTTSISNIGISNDEINIVEAIKKLGASCYINGDEIIIKSSGNYSFKGNVNAGESGLGLRMLVPILSLSENENQIITEGSLKQRPTDFEILKDLGVRISSENGSIKVKGPLLPKNIKIDGSTGSQYLTGLLIAFANACRSDVIIEVENLVSKPYIDITIEMLRLFSCNIQHQDYKTFFISPRTKIERSIKINVESDWSNAAFFLVAGAISGEVVINNLEHGSSQGDKAIIKVLKSSNAGLEIKENKIRSYKSGKLSAFNFDATDNPDLFPPLVALASFCKGTSVIKGVNRLLIKESNRAKSLKEVFTRMGINVRIEKNEMFILGGSKIKSVTVKSHNDHRIVMAVAIAAIASNGILNIEGAEAVNKSYPLFFEHLKSLGANVLLT